MIKLIYANLFRLRKSRVFWCALAALAAVSAYLGYGAGWRKGYAALVFMATPYLCCFLYAAFIGLFVGTEYADGTMRNKLCVGYSRAAVYFANFVVGAIACVAFQLVVFIMIGIVERPTLSTAYSLWDVVFFMGCVLLFTVAFVALYTAIVMFCTRQVVGLLAALGLSIMLLFVTSAIQDRLDEPEYRVSNYAIVIGGDGAAQWSFPADEEEQEKEQVPNPLYIPEGPLRTTLETINQFFPYEAMRKVANFYSPYSGAPDPANYAHWPFCALLFMAFANSVGFALFRKRDLK